MSDSLTHNKSWVQNFVERAMAPVQHAKPATPLGYVKEAGTVAGSYAVAGGVAGILGAAHAKIGLDTRWGPIDGALAGAGAIAAVALSGSHPAAAAVACRAGSTAFAMLMFRKSYELVTGTPMSGSAVMHGGAGGVRRIAPPGKGPGIAGEDRIVKIASGLDGI